MGQDWDLFKKFLMKTNSSKRKMSRYFWDWLLAHNHEQKCEQITRCLRAHDHYLSFVVLICGATVELQFGVGIVTLIILAHPGDEGEVLCVLQPQCPWEQEVDKFVVFEGKAEVVEVPQHEGIGLDGGGLNDAVENHPVTIVLEDAGGDQLGAVVAAISLANLQRWQDLLLKHSSKTFTVICFLLSF